MGLGSDNNEDHEGRRGWGNVPQAFGTLIMEIFDSVYSLRVKKKEKEKLI